MNPDQRGCYCSLDEQARSRLSASCCEVASSSSLTRSSFCLLVDLCSLKSIQAVSRPPSFPPFLFLLLRRARHKCSLKRFVFRNGNRWGGMVPSTLSRLWGQFTPMGRSITQTALTQFKTIINQFQPVKKPQHHDSSRMHAGKWPVFYVCNI